MTRFATLPCSVLLAALLCWLSLAGVAAAQANTNTRLGTDALESNTTGVQNTAIGAEALEQNTTGSFNTAVGFEALNLSATGIENTAVGANALQRNTDSTANVAVGGRALFSNTTGNANVAVGVLALQNNVTGTGNTAIGTSADVGAGPGVDVSNATAIGNEAFADADNKIRLGNERVTVIEGQVAFTSVSDKTKKENFQPVDGEAVLRKMRGLALSSWNFIGQDPHAFRHYGPMAQDFFAAFGHDGVGQIGSETTINAGDLVGILMSAVQALEQRTAALHQKEARIAVLESTVTDLLAQRTAALHQKEAQMAVLASTVEDLKAKYASLETIAARLEALEWRQNPSLQITAENSRGSKRVDVMP
jgi:trimeric autotransporter adhesin